MSQDRREDSKNMMFSCFKEDVLDADGIVNWMTDHLSSFRHTLRDSEPYDMVWIDDEGAYYVTTGCTLRDCVTKAFRKMDSKLINT